MLGSRKFTRKTGLQKPPNISIWLFSPERSGHFYERTQLPNCLEWNLTCWPRKRQGLVPSHHTSRIKFRNAWLGFGVTWRQKQKPHARLLPKFVYSQLTIQINKHIHTQSTYLFTRLGQGNAPVSSSSEFRFWHLRFLSTGGSSIDKRRAPANKGWWLVFHLSPPVDSILERREQLSLLKATRIKRTR